jgi:hypothetical protein
MTRYISRKHDSQHGPYIVYDTVMQITVFHWHGATGKEKCDAVAAALNALGHEKD